MSRSIFGIIEDSTEDAVVTAQTPLILSGGRPTIPPTYNLSTLSGYGTSGQIIRSTGIALQYDSEAVYTTGNVLQLVGTEFSVNQASFATVNNDFAESDFIPYFKADGVTFRKITRLALLENINYLAASPIVKNNLTFTYELDFTGLSTNDDVITDTSEFIISTDVKPDNPFIEIVLLVEVTSVISNGNVAVLAKLRIFRLMMLRFVSSLLLRIFLDI